MVEKKDAHMRFGKFLEEIKDLPLNMHPAQKKVMEAPGRIVAVVPRRSRLIMPRLPRMKMPRW